MFINVQTLHMVYRIYLHDCGIPTLYTNCSLKPDDDLRVLPLITNLSYI